jgi:predicted dehydrogenase
MSRQTTAVRRREFLATATAAMSAAWTVPSGVLAARGRPGANERITVGLIGVGGMGNGHLNMLKRFRELGEVNIAAVCDIDEKRLASAAQSATDKTIPYRDYRYILDRDDIDAVVIATPDHWHAVQAVHACEAGKHVNVEKPSSVTIEEGNAMIAAAREHNVEVQVGSQARSAVPAHQACTYIRNGQIGRVRKVTCWHGVNPTGGTQPDTRPPAQLDWDMWLGPMRWRPHNTAYYHGSFRWILESGGGVIRDRGAHVFSTIRWCLDADDQHPVTIEATGFPPTRGIWDCPPKMDVVYTFKDPDWTCIWAQPGERESNFPERNKDFGMVFHGDDEKLVLDRDGTRYEAPEKVRSFKIPANGVQVHRVDRFDDYNMNHKQDWLEAIRTGRKPVMDIVAGHNAATMCILGNLSYILGRKLHWDGQNQRLIGDETANRLLGQPQRHPYHL